MGNRGIQGEGEEEEEEKVIEKEEGEVGVPGERWGGGDRIFWWRILLRKMCFLRSVMR